MGESAILVSRRELGPGKPLPPASLKKTIIPSGSAMALGMAGRGRRLA